MPNHGTPSPVFPNWYLKFQTKVLENLPRPGDEEGGIDEGTALGWADNGEVLARILRRELAPPRAEPEPQPEPTDFFRETGELTIKIPALPRPTLKEIKNKFSGRFSWVKSIERDNSPTDAVTLKLVTVLREGETRINGSEYERRIAPKQDIILSFQQAVWLEEHQDEFPEFMALLGKVYIDFPGIVVVGGDGRRFVFYLHQDGKRWYVDYRWLGSGFHRRGRVAFSSK